MFYLTPITAIILIGTLIISWRAMENSALFEKLLNNPYRIKHNKEYYRIFSHALIHADFMHLALNMYVFYSFGSILEVIFKGMWGGAKGGVMFIILYVMGAVVATLPSLRKHGDNYGYNSVGASGAVSALLMTYMFMFPTQQISFFFIIPMPAFLGVFVFFLLEHLMNRSGKTRIAHDAHIWGALFGIVFTLVTNPHAFVNFFSTVRQYVMG
jgi:membrane associated rhomboid family serine protease